MKLIRLTRLLALGAGGMDFLTGVGLMLVPQRLLPLMQVELPEQSAVVFLRWIGAFVCGVGMLYGYALLAGGRSRMRGVLECTLILRLSVGIFSLAAITTGGLSMAWWSVPAADLSLVILQAWILWAGDWQND